MTRRGRLILVVGPSGAGKDSIIAGAASAFCGDSRIVFARRMITRPAGAGGEDHIAVAPDEFDAYRRRGGLMLEWQAHGLSYGLPWESSAALDSGCCVVANVSRTVVAAAREQFAPVAVVAITAAPETLAARLADRGRETAVDIGGRLQRNRTLDAVDADFVIDNNGLLESAAAAFTRLLRLFADYAAPASR